MRLPLSPTLDAALARGSVLPHGRLQKLDAAGHVINDAVAVDELWQAPVNDAVQAWVGLEANVPGLQLVSVYARGSIVRGLGLPGISDIDTLGYAIVDTTAAASEIRAWRRERSEELRGRHAAVASGFDLELVAAPRDSAIGRWLLGEAEATALRAADLQELDAFRMKTQARLRAPRRPSPPDRPSPSVRHLPPRRCTCTARGWTRGSRASRRGRGCCSRSAAMWRAPSTRWRG